MKTQPWVCRKSEGEWLTVLGMKIKFLCTSEHSEGRYSSMLNTVPKGMGAPPHKHPWDEAFYVINGCLELRIGQATHVLQQGDYVLVPANSTHAFNGLSSEEGLLIAFESPSHSHHFFKEIHDTIHCIPDDLIKMSEIGNRHHVTFVNEEGLPCKA